MLIKSKSSLGSGVSPEKKNIPSIDSFEMLRLKARILILQGTTISHLGERKSIFKSALGNGYVSSQEGTTISMGGGADKCFIRLNLVESYL